eukprot:684835-Prorocentrum_minimum.AAC.1
MSGSSPSGASSKGREYTRSGHQLQKVRENIPVADTNCRRGERIYLRPRLFVRPQRERDQVAEGVAVLRHAALRVQPPPPRPAQCWGTLSQCRVPWRSAGVPWRSGAVLGYPGAVPGWGTLAQWRRAGIPGCSAVLGYPGAVLGYPGAVLGWGTRVQCWGTRAQCRGGVPGSSAGVPGRSAGVGYPGAVAQWRGWVPWRSGAVPGWGTPAQCRGTRAQCWGTLAQSPSQASVGLDVAITPLQVFIKTHGLNGSQQRQTYGFTGCNSAKPTDLQ